MENSNPAADPGGQPTSGGGGESPPNASPVNAPPASKPVASFSPDTGGTTAASGGASGDATVSFRLKLTITNGATLFGGAIVGGRLIGEGDEFKGDLVAELEGSATISGADDLFGGAVVGGKLIGGGDESGTGGRRRQAYNTAEGGGGTAAD